MNKDRNDLENGLIKMTIQGKPNIWGRFKIRIWTAIFFPIIKIGWRDNEQG